MTRPRTVPGKTGELGEASALKGAAKGDDDTVPMLDLRRQQEAIKDRLLQAVIDVVRDANYLPCRWPMPFEERFAGYCGHSYCVGVGSGTAALHIALLASGIGSGDEVVSVPNSFFATTEAILHVGARPVFADVDPRTHLISLDGLREVITERTRAVLPVHLFGNVVDVDGIYDLLDALGRSDIVVIEDCAHAAGAWRGGRSVPLGGIGAFSFNPGKNIGAFGDAGAIVTSDPELARQARLLRDHGRAQKNLHQLIGFNSRLSRINERVLDIKMDYLDEWNGRRRQVARRYEQAFVDLPALTPVQTGPTVGAAWHQYVVCTPNRDPLRAYLRDCGITTAIHYPSLIPDLEPLRRLGYRTEELPTAVSLNQQILSLPCHPELTDAEAQRVIDTVSAFETGRGGG